MLIDNLREDTERQLKGDETDDDDAAPGKLPSQLATNTIDDVVVEENGDDALVEPEEEGNPEA